MCEGSILSEVYIVFACLMKLKGLVSKHLSVSQLRGITRGRSYCLADIINVSMIFLRDGTMQIAYCDAGAILDEDFSSVMQSPQVGSSYVDAAVGDNYGKSFSTGNALVNELRHGFKQYDIQLKPLFSAFHWKNLGLTSLRSFMLFYLPLLEPRPPTEDEDDEDFLAENPIEHHVDLVEPFKKSVIQIIRETSVVTTRRILERLAVHYASQRIAWKLLKGHLLGDAASWAVQVGLDMYGFIYCTAKSKKDIHETTHMKDEFKILGKKVYGTTVRCAASLVFASVGAGIGATLIHPSTGQWVGCALGDLGGPIIIALCFEKLRWVL
ncbi:uncharacterized protein LOC121761223 isoform X3 [Salvia splendens]|uniref:uncharacterized protein LOC121761223 isoform X3 n=1 Tax=Salvia splendens TaxID=180675 RepID=UPI001C263259|nr:uncharacterized protein LOC121761223 isoform X3 [Salvia splendens]